LNETLLDSYESFTRHLEDREYFGQKLGLARIQRLLDRLGNPEKKFRSIHIAGTNGKGSTAAMIASILHEAGVRVGLYTSPHLNDFCERIRIAGEPISPDRVLHWGRIIREAEEEPLTFFELATAIAFLHFAEERVPLAVIETGLGGRLDATNVITPLISVITTVGLDHTSHLGNSIEEIAFEKAGIVKPGVPVVTGSLPPQAIEVVREVASARKTACLVMTRTLHPALEVGLPGEHQRQNAMLAMAVALSLEEFGGVPVPVEAVIRGLENVRWPGRLETVSESPWVLLDGAHNRPAMQVLREFLEEHLEGRRLIVLFGAMADKDLRGILSELAPIADRFVFTAPRLKRAADPRKLSEIAASLGKEGAVFDRVDQAIPSILESLGSDEVWLITGSLFLVGEARRWFKKES
jgi:dihydrofolate synthase/folylpolyglutamate synthase